MSWTLIANGIGSSSVGPLVTTGADLIVVSLVFYEVSGAEQLSDNKGNTWTQIGTRLSQGSGLAQAWWYCQAPTVGSGHTFSTTSGIPNLAVQAWSGSAATPLDQTNTATANSSATTIQAGSVTPGESGELVVATVGALVGSFSIDSSFTVSDQGTQATFDIGFAYLAPTGSAQNPTWTASGASPYGLVAAIATFKGSGGGGGSVIPQASYYNQLLGA